VLRAIGAMKYERDRNRRSRTEDTADRLSEKHTGSDNDQEGELLRHADGLLSSMKNKVGWWLDLSVPSPSSIELYLGKTDGD